VKIGLIDLDNTGFPNLALMKLSAWHRRRGEEVCFNFPLSEADITFVSCVFPQNRHKLPALDHVMLGGTGFDVLNTTASYGFTSRGCIRHCPWCVVPAKEGNIKPHASIYEFWDRKHRDIILLDNNLLASPNWRTTLRDLHKEKLRVDFNQGLDIRLVDEEKANCLAKLKYRKQLRFAFDDIRLEKEFRRGMEILKNVGITLSSVMIYFLIGFNSSLDEDLERLKIIKSYKATPFAMRYQEVNSVKAPVYRSDRELHEFARWVDLPHGFYKHIPFTEWLKIRGL